LGGGGGGGGDSLPDEEKSLSGSLMIYAAMMALGRGVRIGI
jgi:hypothetical protein